MDKKIQEAMIQTESSGRPHVIGDTTGPQKEGGPSVGLMQIKEDTAKGLYKQGLLPETWNGKKVKKKNLTTLLKDPEFNKLAGSALFVDNKRRIKAIADKHGKQYTPQELNDLAIKAHNQGVTKTINREILGKEPTLPSVDAYLKKIKSQIPGMEGITPQVPDAPTMTPKFADGGVGRQMLEGGSYGEYPNPMEDQFPSEGSDWATYKLPEDMAKATNLTPSPVKEQIVEPISAQVPIIAPKEQKKEEKENIKAEKQVAKEIAPDKKEEKVIKENLVAARKADINPDIPVEEKDPIKNAYAELMDDYKQAVKEKDKAKRLRSLLSITKAIADFGSRYGAGKAMVAGKFDLKAPETGMKLPSVEDLQQGSTIEDLKSRAALLKHLKGESLSEKDKFYMNLALKQLDLRQKEGEENRALRRQSLEEAQKKEGRIKRQQQINTARGFLKDDPRFKKAVEQGMEFENVNGIIEEVEKGNQNALAALGTKLARAMGEVGVLTDTDVVRYVRGTSWGRKLQDWWKQGAEGTISPETLKDMRASIGTIRKTLNSNVNKVFSNAENRMKVAYPDLDKEVIKGVLGKPALSEEPRPSKSIKKEQRKTSPDSSQLGDGERFMKDPNSGKFVIVDKNNKVLRWAK